MSTIFFIEAARGRYGISGVPDGGIAFERPSSVASEELVTLIKSRKPDSAIRCAISILSSVLSPPICSSAPIIRMPTAISVPIASRIDSRTSKVKRKRFSIDPP